MYYLVKNALFRIFYHLPWHPMFTDISDIRHGISPSAMVPVSDIWNTE